MPRGILLGQFSLPHQEKYTVDLRTYKIDQNTSECQHDTGEIVFIKIKIQEIQEEVSKE